MQTGSITCPIVIPAIGHKKARTDSCINPGIFRFVLE